MSRKYVSLSRLTQAQMCGTKFVRSSTAPRNSFRSTNGVGRAIGSRKKPSRPSAGTKPARKSGGANAATDEGEEEEH